MPKRLLGALLAAAVSTGCAATSQTPETASGWTDPYIWLEDIEGEQALEWARAENTKTLDVLQADPRYDRFFSEALAILQANDRIPYVSFDSYGLSNFWQDEHHTRGVWRRTTLESYRTEAPRWETVLDIDALAAAKGKNWVYEGGNCLPPEERYCLIQLSDGGKDAVVVREFDRESRSFVTGGFNLPEGKQNVAWVDEDTLLIARDWGEGTLTSSGYPFVLKELKRGRPLAEAREVFRGEPNDVWVSPLVLRDSAGIVHAIGVTRGVSYFETETLLFRNEETVRLALPKRAGLGGIADGRLLLRLSEDWAPSGGARFTAGSLLSYDLEEWKRDPLGARPSVVFAPGPRQALNGYRITRNKLILTILDNVQGKAFAYDFREGAWQATPIALPANATIGLSAVSETSDEVLFTVTDYLNPTSLWHYDAATDRMERLKASPERFDASGHVVEQLEATSRDGARIPYFLIRPKDARMDGSTPTLLYGYGGFEISQLPSYAGTMGKLWLEQGGAYVVANLRGGGEFGPAWHQAAQGPDKQRTWDDFIAVAEDLIRRKVTSPRRLGVVGGSQGGLLVGTAITQRPDLFNAALVQVPLLDMLRYTKLGAGASYIGEYGDPDDPEQRKWLEAYSPYQRLVAGTTYPAPFFTTSTKDDRVHPGHARKAAAKLAALGQPYFFYENIDGGHSAAANLKESAQQSALQYTYATKRLAD